MLSLLRVTLDHELTFQAANRPYRNLIGRSALDYVLPTYRERLQCACGDLFKRRRFVTCELPALVPGARKPVWWVIRAAPLGVARRPVVALAHATPRDRVRTVAARPVSAETWQCQLALRELIPILRPCDAEVLSIFGSQPQAFEYDF